MQTYDNKGHLLAIGNNTVQTEYHKKLNPSVNKKHSNLRQTVRCIPSTAAETPSPFHHTTTQHNK